MRTWILLLFFFFVAFPAANSKHIVKERHVAYFPKHTYTDREYCIFFLSFNTNYPTRVKIYINKIEKNSYLVKPGAPVILKTNITRPGKNLVQLTATGGSNFVKLVMVYNIRYHKKAAIFLQMDKYTYYTGGYILFRCFALDTNFKVLRKPLDIKIYDAGRTLIDAHYNQASTTGVISKSLHIAKKASTGAWRIDVYQRKLKLSQTLYFRVEAADYKYATVKISGDRYYFHLGLPFKSYSQQYMRIVINAKYVSGLPMIGKLVLRIRSSASAIFTRTFNINGKFVYRFQLKEFLKFRRHTSRLSFEATVFESRNNFHETSGRYTIFSYRYYPVYMRLPFIIIQKEGLHQILIVSVRRYDQTKQLTFAESQGTLNVTFVGCSTSVSSIHCSTLVGDIRIPLPSMHLKYVIVSYTSHYQIMKYDLSKRIHVTQFSRGHPQIQAYTCDEHYYAGDTIYIHVNSTVQMKIIYYMIMRDNWPIMTGTVYAFGDKMIVGIKTLTSWAPSIRIVFTVVTFTEYTLIDALVVYLEPNIPYQVEGNFSSSLAYSGSQSTLTMRSAGRSTLFYTAVDDYGPSLGENKYISMEMIIRRLFRWDFRKCSHVFTNLRTLFWWARLDVCTNMFSVAKLPILSGFLCDYERPLVNNVEPINQRHDFYNPWFWSDRYMGPNERGFKEKRFVPYTVAKYDLHAFAVHPTKGISVLKDESRIQVNPKVWFNFHLPPAVFVGEQFKTFIVIYNYLLYRQRVKVILYDKTLVCRGKNVKIVYVRPKSYTYVSFSFCPQKVGLRTVYIALLLGRKRVDMYIQKLLVKEIGHTVYYTNEKRIRLNRRKHILSLPKPKKGALSRSIVIGFSLSGDIIANVLSKIGNLVPPPNDCSEQMASIFSYSVYTYEYLQARRSLRGLYKRKLIFEIKDGYQNLQRYRRYDGSYLICPRHGVGSVWVTASACKYIYSVIQSRMDVVIDKISLKSSLGWLLRNQQPDGSFREASIIIHTGMQMVRARSSPPLTANVLMTLVSMQHILPVKAKIAIVKAKLYLMKLNLKKLNIYTLCILFHTYAKIRNRKYYRKLYRILRRISTRGRQTMHWKGPYDVEQTCHALLGCYYTRKRYTGERILNWLLSQRNSHGGFDNTQDTAICVEAFSKFGRFLRRVRNARIRVKSNRGFKKTYTYKKGKRLLWVYNAELNSRTKRVTLRSGWGIRMKGRLRRQYVIAKVTMRYNSVTPMNDNFGLVATVVAKSSKYLEIKMCLSWKQSIASGLLISSVQLPTGYFRNSVACGKKICRNGKCVPDHSCLDQIQDIDGEVVIYLKSMHYRRSFCVVIKAVKCRIVTLRQKVLFITTVQYYTGAQIVLPYRLK